MLKYRGRFVQSFKSKTFDRVPQTFCRTSSVWAKSFWRTRARITTVAALAIVLEIYHFFYSVYTRFYPLPRAFKKFVWNTIRQVQTSCDRRSGIVWGHPYDRLRFLSVEQKVERNAYITYRLYARGVQTVVRGFAESRVYDRAAVLLW